MIDASKVMYEFLTKTGTTLYAQTATRCWSPIAPVGFKNSSAAIIYHFEDEQWESATGVMLLIVVFKCYGGSNSFATARGIGSLLGDRLHRKGEDTTSGRIMHARQISTPSPDRAEPDTGYPVYVTKYQIMMEAK